MTSFWIEDDMDFWLMAHDDANDPRPFFGPHFGDLINGMGDDHGDDLPDDGEGEERRQAGLLLKPRPKTKKPSMYKVLLLNDDYTPMEFVVHVLERFFSKNRQEATDIMLHVHRRGVGICGIFTYEVAETKVAQVMDFARASEQPLQCTMEKE
ncbi:ATP-dependent Clp protease adapter ClpS [Micavibrio aeruginosavorus]|uniref:ATP-dependent Clp protease adapter protein ClpS n=1 Tax=Micavibrio aeruginosavorus (strain ARL-13) TaxID=856793 RepID=G2KMF3_MICAA|nr:ATP-dependent Clp protease adapter ClpS [Micavibrio aeruginosavorus]AEP10646.1 ATP-dependent Clp protease adapter clpS domain protein [Micavibrio aeruginosavorus ARL-13]